MGKIRKPGRAMTRTYIKMKTTAGTKSFQARVMDLRVGTDIKCSGKTIDRALRCARNRAIKERRA
jgi:hypothetical protein